MYDNNYKSDKSYWTRYGNPIMDLAKSGILGGVTGFVVGAIAGAILWVLGTMLTWGIQDASDVFRLGKFVVFICGTGAAGAMIGLILAPLAHIWWQESFIDRLAHPNDSMDSRGGDDASRKRPNGDSSTFNQKHSSNKDK